MTVVDLGLDNSSNDIKVGDIFLIKANEENRITPKDWEEYRLKYFAVLGFYPDGSVFGCVVFDSILNLGCIPPDDIEFYLPISKGSYNFIKHDSFLDCHELKPTNPQKLLNGKYMGRLTDIHLRKAKELISMSPHTNFIQLRMFGLK